MARRILAGLALAAALAAVIAFLFLREDPAQTAREEDQGRAPTSIETAQAPVEAAAHPSSGAGERSALPTPHVELSVPGLELLVVAADGNPTAGAELVIFRGEEVLETATTDARGLARFPARTGGAEVAVCAPGHAVMRAPIELEAGRRNVTLPDGAIVSGRVLVDGAAPTEPIEIHLQTQQISRSLQAIPKSVFTCFQSTLEKRSDRTSIALLGNQFQVTDAEGNFAFHGLQPDATGQLTWDGPLVREGVEPGTSLWSLGRIHFFMPRADFELRLTVGIELALRVVDETGAPVPEAHVEIKCEREKADASTQALTLLGAADDQGRFHALLGRTPPTELEVHIHGGEFEGEVVHKLVCPPGLLGVFDAGDLALAKSRKLQVHAQEVDGTPIVGALGVPFPSGARSKARSDAEGNFVLAMEQRDLRFQAKALGYESRLVEVPPDASSIVVILTKACLLEFTIPDYPGVDRRFLSVRVQGEAPILIDEKGPVPLLQSPYSGRREQQGAGPASYSTSTDQDGRWRIAGLVPGNPLRAELATPTGRVLARADIAPLAWAERRIVALAIDHLPKSLRVHVQDPDRRPLTAAAVFVKEPSGIAESKGTTDYTGSCTISQIYSERFTVRVDAEGFPTAYEYGLQMPREEITVVLEPPRTLEIELVQADGSAFARAEVQAGVSRESLKLGKPTTPGHWIVRELPLGEVEIQVRTRTESLSRIHDTAEPFRRLVVGEKGEVQAYVTLPEGEFAGDWSVAIYASGRTKVEERHGITSGFRGLPLGAYDVWLERRAPEPPCRWTRVGEAVQVVLDAEHPSADAELNPDQR